MHSISNGYICLANDSQLEQIRSTVSLMYLDHGNVFSAYATLAAYNKSEAWINEVLEYLHETVNFADRFIRDELPKVKMFRPEGTYQIWLDFSALGLTPENLNHMIVDRAKLALTHGAWFGENHEQFVRINIASPLANIQKALMQLKNVINEDTGINKMVDTLRPCCC